MGVLKKYSPAIACDAMRLYGANTGSETGGRTVPVWYDISGTKYTTLLGTSNPNGNGKAWDYANNLTGFDSNMVPVATADTLDNYSVFDYGISSIGTANYNKSISRNEYGTDLAYTVRISNSNPTDDYIQNADPIWRDYIEYYTRSGEEGAYIYTRVYDKPSDFITTYNTYYILVPAGPIVVKCIKFKKNVQINPSSSTINTISTSYCAYFLDEEEWVTVPVGESRVIVVDFSAITA